jgi:hypothetical protein
MTVGLTTITVTETFVPDQPGGATPTGEVTFTLSARVHDAAGNEVQPEPIVALLVSGAISVELYANDDAAAHPQGTFYTVNFFINGVGQRPPIQITVPHTAASGTCTLASLS